MKNKTAQMALFSLLLFLIINSFSLLSLVDVPWLCVSLIPVFILINVFPSFNKSPTIRIRILSDGVNLLVLFLITSIVTVIYMLLGLLIFISLMLPLFWASAAFIYIAESVLFWNGMIRIYLTSEQLGLRWRIAGIICGLIPVINLIVLVFMLIIAGREVEYETEKYYFNNARAECAECMTRYPIMLVHGVFFRDNRYLNYWGRIPNELQRNGATVYYGEQQSAAAISANGAQLAARIKHIAESTGCERVNVIAHSKGGLDMRWAIANCGAAPYVATLTTVNTPHRGCIFADYLLGKVSPHLAHFVANSYNKALRRLGDKNPDFMTAVQNLTASYCTGFNKNVPDSPEVKYFSVGSFMNRPSSGRFPLNIVNPFVKHFDGKNDGLVALSSMRWGERFTVASVTGERGISHSDIIDMSRENISKFDVREFYVQIVHELKENGF